MENKNNIDWNVNLNYITKDDLKTIYGFIPDADQTTTDNTKTDFTIMAIAISSERINTITGNQIEVIGFKNLNETQQTLVKRATARMTIYYLTDGMAFIRSSVSISGNGLSSSISPPSEPDYVLMEVYNLLQQANLHTPRKAINNPISCNTDNFNTPNIFDESDRRVITWDSGNKTFLRKEGLIAGTGIKIDDVSDTIPKLKIHVDSNIDSLWEVNIDNPNFIKPKDDKGIDVNGRRIIDVGTPTFLSDATTKVYVDNLLDKKQDKLTAGEGIAIENNVISTTKSEESLWEYDPNSPNILQPKIKGDVKPLITSNNTRIVDIADPTQPQDAVNKRYVDNLENRIFNNSTDKDNTTRLVTEVVRFGSATLTYKNSPNITIDNDIPNKKYVDEKIKNINIVSNWKEVGTKININHIQYDFKANTKYRIYYNFESQTSNKKFCFICKEFLYGELNTDVQTLDWDKVNDRIMVSLQIQNNTIAVVSDPTKYGQLLKLEELQE